MAKATAEDNRRFEEQYRRDRLKKEPPTCVSCGLAIEMTADGYLNHRCPESHENRVRGIDRQCYDSPVRPQFPAERYADGFKMMFGCEQE